MYGYNYYQRGGGGVVYHMMGGAVPIPVEPFLYLLLRPHLRELLHVPGIGGEGGGGRQLGQHSPVLPFCSACC